jgi:hypothetical protein
LVVAVKLFPGMTDFGVTWFTIPAVFRFSSEVFLSPV